MKTYLIDINPVSKPRMVRSDKWKKRAITDHYWAFKDELKLKCNIAGLKNLPPSIHAIRFIIPMPKSWTLTQKTINNGQPHMQTPDLDNLIKALQDCLCSQDKHIWQIDSIEKRWGEKGSIMIVII